MRGYDVHQHQEKRNETFLIKHVVFLRTMKGNDVLIFLMACELDRFDSDLHSHHLTLNISQYVALRNMNVVIC